MEGQVAKVTTQNPINMDLLAGYFEADAGYEIESLSQDQLHISMADKNMVEEILITKKPTYKGGGVFEVQLLSEANDGAYNAGYKLGRMFSGKTLTSHIVEAILGIDAGLSNLQSITSAQSEGAAQALDIPSIGYAQFAELRQKHQAELRKMNNVEAETPKTAGQSNSGEQTTELTWQQWLILIGVTIFCISLLRSCFCK